MLINKLLESLPQSAYSATQVLENEEKIGQLKNITMIDLMEKAGQSAFRHLHSEYAMLSHILVICGKGNNGGDGFVIARLAAERGIQVTLYLCAEKNQLKGHAKTMYDRLGKNNLNIIEQNERPLTNEFLGENQYQLIVDALFGIGFSGQLPESLEQLITVVNEHDVPILSIDVPSGLEASTGHVISRAIIAQQTVTFIAVKQGLLTGQSANHVGELYLADLSLGQCFQQNVTTDFSVQGQHSQPNMPSRNAACHKGNIGLLLTFGGNQGMPGAIRLASEAALRTGAALVSVYCHRENHQMVVHGRPELMLASAVDMPLDEHPHFKKAKVLLCGPGLGQNQWAKDLFTLVVNSSKPCVLDADALSLLATTNKKRNDWVLTPHAGEAAKLLSCTIAEVERNRFSAVKKIVEKYGGICVLKGAGSLIANGENNWINTSGNSGMATAGMGDVLSGIIAALLMQLAKPIDAVRLAVQLHGQAADIIKDRQGEVGMLASDLLSELPYLLNQDNR